MSSWGVALLSVGGVALLLGTALRAIRSRVTLDDDQGRGAKRLTYALHAVAGALLLVGLVLVMLR